MYHFSKFITRFLPALIVLATALPGMAELPYFAQRGADGHPLAPAVRQARTQSNFSEAALDARFENPDSPIGNPVKKGLAVKDPEDANVRTNAYSNLEGPDGSGWNYSMRYTTKDVYYNEYYTDRIKQTFTCTVTDDQGRIVGTVKNKLRYADNEIRDVECVPDPAITRYFFNTDDKPEIMIYHAMNTDVYINHYYYEVYTIGGEKDREGYDIPIMTIEGRCVEAVNMSNDPDVEDFFITFTLDPVVNWPLDDPNYLEKLHAAYFHLSTYVKAENDTDGPSILHEHNVYGTRIPGDTTEGIYYMSKEAAGKYYFIYSQYDKPFFVDPRGGAIDESATPDNSLKIEVFATSDHKTVEEISTTLIPVNAEESTNFLMYTFLSIGSLAWKDDVDMVVNGTPDAPAFIVMRTVAQANSLDDGLSEFAIYDNNGNYLHPIAQNAYDYVVYPHGIDEEPIAMFIIIDKNNEVWFDFTRLYSGEVLGKIPQQNGGDPLWASSCAPMKYGDTYRFAFEMQRFENDLAGNTYGRIAWFDTNSVLIRIDYLNYGKSVQASLANITPFSLNPYLYDTDPEMEYAVLVKRTSGSTIRNEFLIIDDTGEWYAQFSNSDGYGEPSYFNLIPGDPNMFMIVFSRRTLLYTLPFDSFDKPEGWEPPVEYPEPPLKEEPEDTGVEFVIDGNDIPAPEYYDLSGRRVVNPASGIYIRKSGSKVEKIAI